MIKNNFIEEEKIYKIWLKNKLSYPNYKKNKKKFSIIMPPPNITGNLHIGHVFQQTLMDILIRYHKMQGFNTIWIMGTDHAGISTQLMVENKINNKKNKKSLIKEIWKWKNKYEKKINKQTKQIGSLVYWKKTRFTLDKKFSNTVNKAFIKLYKNKLIYKDIKIVSWDKKIKTVLSDIETYKKKKTILKYYIKFYIHEPQKIKFIIIPTTKIKYISAITGILINHKIKKYKKIIKKYAINPLNNNLIKIINIKNKKKKKIKKKIIIPAHNEEDYKIAKKKKINIINILKKNGKLKKKTSLYNYKLIKIKNIYNNKITNKKKIIDYLTKNNFITKIKKCKKKIIYSSKTNTRIIKIIKKQWYLKTSKLSKKAIKIIKKNKIKFKPKKYKNLFFHWMKNIKDWCISRQIKWGHKIPIWYDENNKIYIGKNKKQIFKKYKIINKTIKRDKNVLDTWFSSSLWSFGSLGWPQKTKEFKNFHPISLVVSGFDIIFFWISRMIMMTLYLIKKNKIDQIPFKNVLITGLITDEDNKKMSKSLGNVIDFEDIIKGINLKKLIKKRTNNLIKIKNKNNIIKNTKKFFPKGIKKYGTDVLRFTLSKIFTSKLKIKFNINNLNEGYKFYNKLWNIFNYIKKYLKSYKKKNKKYKINILDIWIKREFNKTINKYHLLIKKLRFDKLCICINKFLKNKFSDWYIELFKINEKNNKIKQNSINNIISLYLNILKISHPITPFITEYIWQKIRKKIYNIKKSILLEKIPKIKIIKKKNNYIESILIIKKIIKIIRKIQFISPTNIVILNLDLIKKKIIKNNKHLLKNFNTNKIFFFKKKFFIKKKISLKYKKPKIIFRNNIYITYKNKN